MPSSEDPTTSSFDSPDKNSAPSIEQVIAEFVEQTEKSLSPKKEDFLRRYPQFRIELSEFFEVHDQFTNSSNKLTFAKTGTQVSMRPIGESSITTNPPQFLGDYEILDEIDRGGMGVVYKARHQKLNRVVALKLIRSGELASEEEVQRFMSEAEAAAALNHPCIVPIYEVGAINGLVFYTMAFIEGKSLSELVKEQALDAMEAVRIVRKLCSAVAYAHSQGIYHRDLKPANVLVNSEGMPIIIDFGLAKVANHDDSLTATGQILGTPAYMTPEHAAGKAKHIGPAADVYALGAILYFLCTRQPAFSGPTPFDVLIQVLDKRPPRPSKVNKSLDKSLDVVCLKSLEKKPAERYQSAKELAVDLEKILTGEPIDGPQESSLEKLRKWWQREPILAAHTLGIGATTVVVVLFYLIRGESSELFYYRVGLLLIWLSLSFFLQSWVNIAQWTHVAIFSWLAIDVTIYTSLIAFASPPRSMLLIGYPMMIVASALYYQRRFTVTKTLLCIVGFGILGGLFPKEDFNKLDFIAIFMIGLVVISLCMVAMINRVRGLSRFYEE